jgi:hypothetical protein
METQYEWMLATAESWADKLRAGYLPRHLTWQAWKTTIQKTLEYPLPVTTLTRKQCDKISSTLANAALPRCGILRTFPRALVYAPIKVGGLDIPNLYIEQGIGHILRLIRYSQSQNHSTGKLLRFTCEAFKLQLGCNGRLWEIPRVLAPLATQSWIKSTWEFLHEYNNISISDDIPDFQPLRLGDRLIIPTTAAMGFSPAELNYINQCRLFLQVTWVSECVSADGQHLERRAFHYPYKLDHKKLFHYPAQQCPSAAAWALWSKAFSMMCVQKGRLRDGLGAWIRKDAVRRWFDQTTDRLYENQRDRIQEYSRVRGKTRATSARFALIGESDKLPNGVVPATAFIQQHTIYMTSTGQLERSFIT